jgi:hypothetical protein
VIGIARSLALPEGSSLTKAVSFDGFEMRLDAAECPTYGWCRSPAEMISSQSGESGRDSMAASRSEIGSSG